MSGRHRADRLIASREVGLPEPFCRCGHSEGLHLARPLTRGRVAPCAGRVGHERCTCQGYYEGRLSAVVRDEILERAARRRRRSADAGS